MNHQNLTIPQVIPQVAYQSTQAPTQLMTESPFVDSGFAVPVFSLGDDPIACLNKAMAFLTVVASSRFPSTNNQLRTSSNPRNQATIQDGRVTVQQPKRPRNTAWYKEKAILVEAQEAGQILDEEQLAFLADPGIPVGRAQTIIPHNAAFQTEDLDTYHSDCDDLSTAQAVLVANISNYSSNVISEFDTIVKKRTTPNALEEAVEILEYFEINDLKAQLQDKDKTICKLKDTIKSLRENTKEQNVNHDKCELEPINKELENSVAKLLSKNERLCNEINHVKHVFKDQFDSIKQTRVRHKEQSDSLINKLNLKSVENEDFKAQIQDKVESSNTSDSNTPVLSSTGVKCSTSNYRSKPPRQYKNDRISQDTQVEEEE
ncbi:hypothetical protein Tco_0895061 [Tanacetum coccineum]|uniref:Uncharacterized protein n=1 Tax=Tanacetum coccineum TaxID=301880 RepID=A0ABQ5CJT3_9ASTR